MALTNIARVRKDSLVVLLMSIVQLLFVLQSTTYAQTTNRNTAGALEEIIVTATRRESNLQDTPITISAINGDLLRNRGLTDPRDLTSLAPNLYVDQGLSTGQTHVSIRGLASTDFSLGSASPVGIYLDDVYQPFQFGIATQVYDVNRIEVLRGPQGTLFGKNTNGGALIYYSQLPTDEQEGYLVLNGGGDDFGHYSAEGAYNQPLSENLAMRVSMRVSHRDDYIDNVLNDEEIGRFTNFNGRIQFAWKPSDDTNVNLKIFGLHNDGDGPVYIGQWLGGECAGPLSIYNRCDANGVAAPDSPDSRTTNADVTDIREDFDSYGITLNVQHDIGDYSLTSISAWQEGHFLLTNNDDGTAGDLFHSRQKSKTSQYSQELRLATPVSSPLSAVIGLYAQYDKIIADQASGSTLLDPTLGFEYVQGAFAVQKTTTLAAFTSVTYNVNDTFSLIGGLRYSWERKKNSSDVIQLFGFDFVNFTTRDFTDPNSVPRALSQFTPDPNFGDLTALFRTNDTWNRVTWDITANYRPNENSLLYARISTGFRSGGAPVGTTQVDNFNVVRPEDVTSYEVGFKSDWLENKLRINGAGFYLEYDDMQVQSSNPTGPGLIINNAANSTIYGAEIEIEAVPADSLHLNASFGYTNAEFDIYLSQFGDASGNRLGYAPEWSVNLGGNYEVPVGNKHSVILGTNWMHRSKVFFGPFEDPFAGDSSLWSGDLRLSYGTVEPGYRLTAYAKNITNEEIKAFAFNIGFTAPTIYSPKRTIGVMLAYDF